jgi:opacity protein-like surface antigen
VKKLLIAAVAAAALSVAATASAALQPGVFDPEHHLCVTSTYSNGVLHLAKTCPTATNASAGADITGFTGAMFQSGSFTLASASQCQGGSPRFNIFTTGGTFFLGCNNVTPTTNADGTVTYTFSPADLQPAVAGTTPGTITGVEILIDVQGTADVSNIIVNGKLQKPAPVRQSASSKCKHGGWKTFTSPKFKNQGQCVSYFMHQLHMPKQHHHH